MKIKNYIFLTAGLGLCFSSCNLDRFPLDKETLDTYFQDAAQMQSFSNTFYAELFDDPIYNADNDLYMGKTLPPIIRGGTSRITPSSGGGWSWETLRSINTMLGYMDNCRDEAVKKEYAALARFFRCYFYWKKVRDFGDVPWYDRELGSAETPELYKARDSRDFVMEKMIEDIDFAIANLPSGKNLYRVTKWTALAFKSRFCLFEGTWRKYHDLSLEHDADYYLRLAADAAKLFIETSPYSIYNSGNPSDNYLMLFAQDKAPMEEVILAKNYSVDTQVSHFATYVTFGIGEGRNINKKFVDAFLMADGSRYTDKPGWEEEVYYDEVTGRDPRLAQIIRCPGYHRLDDATVLVPEFANSMTGYQTVKYAVSYETIKDTWQASDNDLPLFRAAEVYLNYAEAMAERSDVSITQADIDMSIKPLRDRVGMPSLNLAAANASPDNNYMGSAKYGYRNVKGDNKGVILEIRRERMVELAQEGDFRWYDLMRWHEGLCIEQSILGQYFPGPGEYDLDGDGAVDLCLFEGDENPVTTARFVHKIGTDLKLTGGNKGNVDAFSTQRHTFNEKRDYLKPIPTGEMALNTKLSQNPGWKDIKR